MGNHFCADSTSRLSYQQEQSKRQKKPLMPIDANRENEFTLPGDPNEQTLYASQEGTQQDKKVTLECFQIIRVLGSGAFGKVYLVSRRDSSDVYAMKVYNKVTLYEKDLILSTISERNILKNMRSKFIVKLHFAFQAASRLYLIMDFMAGGELFFHLKRVKKFEESRARFYVAQIVLAIECLHDQGIVYRDLKPENILLGIDGYIMLTDFGLSKEGIRGDDLTNTLCGTEEYVSPEQILDQGHNRMADFWQIGILTYEMLCGKTPFYKKGRLNKEETFQNILNGVYEIPKYVSKQASSFIAALLEKNVKTRLGANGFQELKQHEFFKKIDWNSLENKKIKPQFKPTVNLISDLQNFNTKSLRGTLKELTSKEDLPKLDDEIDQQFTGFTYVKDDPMQDN